MNADKKLKFALAGPAAALGCALFLAQAAQARTDSVWSEGLVKVDGAATEWDEEGLTEKDGLALSFANDDKDFYVYVAALDKEAAAQLTGRYKQTFTLWVDGKGSKKKTFGVQLSPKANRPAGGPPKEGSGTPPAMDGKQDEPPAERAASSVTYETALVDAEAELGTLAADGVEFASGLNRRKKTVFEFKVPLALFTVKGGDVLAIGFETSEIDSSAMGGGKGGLSGSSGSAGGPGGGMGGGPGGGMRGGPGGGMGGGPGGGMRGGPGGSASSAATIPDPISFWLKIKLAAKPAARQYR